MSEQHGAHGAHVHQPWHFTIPEYGYVWCVDCRRTVWRDMSEQQASEQELPPCERCGGIGRVEGPMKLDAYDIWDCSACDGTGEGALS